MLGIAAVAQLAIYFASGSVALLADLIHNFGDAGTAIPLGAAFLLRSVRAERWSGLSIRSCSLNQYFTALQQSGQTIFQSPLVCGALVCASLGRPPRQVLQLVVDWLPIVLVLGAYDFTRGAADTLGIGVHAHPMIGVGTAGLFSEGQAGVNMVAAVPSLHSALTALVAMFLWGRVRPRLRPLLALYPLAMGLTLMATGEHYFFDVLLGWLYAGATMAAWGRWERRRAKQPLKREWDHASAQSLVFSTDEIAR